MMRIRDSDCIRRRISDFWNTKIAMSGSTKGIMLLYMCPRAEWAGYIYDPFFDSFGDML
jgi:hypothetical protein